MIERGAPISILDEHPEWSLRLMSELEHRHVPFEKINPSSHDFDPGDRIPRYSAIVNRTSPSSHTRGHGSALFYVESLLAYWEALGIPVINPVAAWRFEKSKALQADLFSRLALPYLRTIVLNDREQVAKAADRLRFPIVLKPNVGGSGAGIIRFDSAAELVGVAPGVSVTRFDAPPEAVDAARRLTRAASIDVGGVEYLVARTRRRTSWPNPQQILGFDPLPRFVDYILRLAGAGRG